MSGAERIHEWLAESSLAFAAANEFPFGRTTLHDLTLDEEDDMFRLSSDDADDEDDNDVPSSAAAAAAAAAATPAASSSSASRRWGHGGRFSSSADVPPAADGGRQEEAVRARSNMAAERPFRYSGRLLLVALPGIALVYSLAGDLLILAQTVGTMIVYLLHVAGLNQKAFVAYICTFGACQIIVIYSAIPLLWHTVLNIFLIGLLNCFSVLTGTWGLLFFDYFRVTEPALARLIETCLFGLYPGINVILLTWIIGSGLSPIVAPYGLLIIGFMVLQLFMTPTPSSFNKPGQKDAEMFLVLDSGIIGAMALAYTVLPPGVYTYLNIVRGDQPLLSAYFVAELIFLGCLSSFLATLMNLREFLEIAGLEYKYLQRARWMFGLTALFLLSCVLHKYGFKVYLLPWLSLGLALHTGYGFFSRHRHHKARSASSALVLLILYSFIFAKLPWKLDLVLERSLLHINYLQMLLFTNVLVCILCVYSSTYFSKETLGLLLVLQSLVFVACEKLLWSSQLYLTSLLPLSSVMALYVLLRLYHADKVNWLPACLSMALHLTKLNSCCDAVLPSYSLERGYSVYEDLTTLLLSSLFIRVLVFEKEVISFRQWVVYMVGCLGTLSLAMPGLLFKCFIIASGVEPTFSDMTALGLLLAALLSVKLSLQTEAKFGWLGLSHVGPTAVVTAAVLFHLKPEPVLTWEEGNKWLAVLILVACFFLVPLASFTRSPSMLSLIGTGLGLPLGISVAVWALPGELDLTAIGLCGVVAACLTSVALFVWREVHQLQVRLYWSLGLIAASVVVLFLVDPVTPDDSPSSGLMISTLSSTTLALILKGHSYREQNVDLLAAGGLPPNNVPVIGNGCTVLAYGLLCLTCPIQVWEIWYIITASTLLMLQPDRLWLSQLSRRNNATPMLLVTALVLWLSTQIHSSLFWSESLLYQLSGCVELLLVWLSVPLYAVYSTVLWQNRFYISDRLVVFLTPVNAFLFIFGSSLQAWVLAVHGLGVGLWLIMYKLPLKTDSG